MFRTSARARSGAMIRLIAVIACVTVSTEFAHAEASCEPLVNGFNAALAKSDFQAIVAAAGSVIESSACRAAVRNSVGRTAAIAHLREAAKIPDTPENAPRRLQLLEAGMRFGHPWQLMATIGDVRKEVRTTDGQPDYQGASLAYQDALRDLADKQRNPEPPPKETIEHIIALAQQDRLAANTFTRGDDLMTRDVRGVVVEEVAVPIQFVFNRVEMTELGRKYAEDMLRVLRDQSMPRIKLIGHTDHVGADRYNVELSRQRAQAVARFLASQGYPAASIYVDGRGWHDPLRITDAAKYNQATVDQMLRRVELKYLDKPQ